MELVRGSEARYAEVSEEMAAGMASVESQLRDIAYQEDPPHILDEVDVEAVQEFSRRHLEAGWTIPETVRVLELMEHIKPTLEEEEALRGMTEITQEVNTRLKNEGKSHGCKC